MVSNAFDDLRVKNTFVVGLRHNQNLRTEIKYLDLKLKQTPLMIFLYIHTQEPISRSL